MIGPESTLLILFAILSFGLIIPDLFRRFKLPYVTTLILLGSLLGPNALGYFQLDPVIEFMGFTGSVFLLLMAGLAVDTEQVRGLGSKIFMLAALNGAVPFIVGFLIVTYFGYNFQTAILIGTIFVSSAISIVFATLRDVGMMRTKIAAAIGSAAIIEDITSLVLLALILQKIAPIVNLSIPAYLLALVGGLALFKTVVPKLANWLDTHVTVHSEDEDQLRLVIVILIASLLFFSIIGVHALIAGFITGLLLRQNITSQKLYDKLHTLGYGLFVPVFFVVVGMEMDLRLLLNFSYENFIIFAVVFGSIFSKLISGYVGARLASFDHKNSLLFGIASTPQLTTTLAVTYAATTLGLLDNTLTTAVLLLTVVTTLFAPTALGLMYSSVQKARA